MVCTDHNYLASRLRWTFKWRISLYIQLKPSSNYLLGIHSWKCSCWVKDCAHFMLWYIIPVTLERWCWRPRPPTAPERPHFPHLTYLACWWVSNQFHWLKWVKNAASFVVVICMSVMTNDVECFSMCSYFLPIYLLWFNVCINFCPFKSYIIEFREFLIYILNTSPWSDIPDKHQSVASVFILLHFQLKKKKDYIFNFNEIQLINFFFVDCTFDATPRTSAGHKFTEVSACVFF